MDHATARARLERMVQHTVHPGLAREELEELLTIGARPDLEGRQPLEAGWVGTWDLNAAAAEGWRWKAAKVAGDESVNADGASFAADAYKGCLAMAAQYDRAPSWSADGVHAGTGMSSMALASRFERTDDDVALHTIANLPEVG